MIRFNKMIPLFLLCVNTYSQNSVPVQVFTPNAAGLGQYGQIPVNYFNGLPAGQASRYGRRMDCGMLPVQERDEVPQGTSLAPV